MRFLLVCLTVPAQAEHLMVKGTYAEREAVINNDALPNDFTKRETCYNLKYLNPNLTRPHQQVTRLVNSIKR